MVTMYNNTGDDLLKTINTLNIDLRNLNPNVIKAWFDTDCKDTKQLLNWMCFSLSDANYVPPLEKAEFMELEHLSSTKCVEELAKLHPNYLSILDADKNLEEILLLQDEIDFLEEENGTLDKLIKVYGNLDSNYSLDLTYKTQKEIKSKVESKKSQDACADLARNLDEVNKIRYERLLTYDPDAQFVNFVNIKDYLKNIDNLNSFLLPLMEIDKSCLEHSDDDFSNELETCKKRILHSQQIYLANKVEIEKLKEILEFLKTINISDNISSWNLVNIQKNIEAKEVYKERVCEILDSIATKFAEYSLKQTRIRYVEKELETHQQKSQNISKILENVTQFLSYYTLTNCLQFEEKKDVEGVSNFYQEMIQYVNNDLQKCRSRTSQMKNVIEDYNTYLSKPEHERSKLVTSIAKILSSDEYTLKSVLEAVGKFKTELNYLESECFSVDVKSEKQKTQTINENVKILQDFLISGPTNRVVVIPINLQNVWFDVEEHLKKESSSVGQAVQIPQTTKKSLTKAQNYTKQLWMSFLTNPSKLDTILKQAEEDFNKRTAHYF